MSNDPIQPRANLPDTQDSEFPDIPPSRRADLSPEEQESLVEGVRRQPHQHASRSRKRARYLRRNASKLLDDTHQLHDEVRGNFLTRLFKGRGRNKRSRSGAIGGFSHGMLRTFMIIIGLLMWLMAGVMVYQRVIQPARVSAQPSQGIVEANIQAESCPAAAQRVGQPAQEVTDPQAEIIPPDEAERQADRTLARYFDYSRNEAPALSSNPHLLQATLPDGQKKLVYARTWIPTYEQSPLDGEEDSTPQSGSSRAAIAYVDAATGHPLVIYTGVTIADPLIAEGCSETFVGEMAENLHMSLQRVGPTVAMVLTLLVGGLMLFVWESAHTEQRQPEQDSVSNPDELEEISGQEDLNLAKVNRRNQNIDPELDQFDL